MNPAILMAALCLGAVTGAWVRSGAAAAAIASVGLAGGILLMQILSMSGRSGTTRKCSSSSFLPAIRQPCTTSSWLSKWPDRWHYIGTYLIAAVLAMRLITRTAGDRYAR
jgi:hypothetical protein